MKKRILACLLALVMLIGVMPVAMAAEAETDGTDGYEWIVSKSKEATALDANKESTITLSLPSAEEKLASDVVFVLDTSDCVGEVMNQVSGLVAQLKSAQEKNKADIKVGVVAFKGSALPMFDGKLVSVEKAETTLNEMIQKVNAAAEKEKENVVLSYLNADKNFIYKGSNLHSGLLGAQALLKDDGAVKDSRKYVVTVTDGMTYYWNDKAGSVYAVYNDELQNPTLSENNQYNWHKVNCLFYAWQSAHNIGSGYSLPSGFDWNDYISGVKNRITVDGDTFVSDLRQVCEKTNRDCSSARYFEGSDPIKAFTDAGFRYVLLNEGGNHALGIERSVVACLDTYQEMVDAGYQCYTLNPDYATDTFPGLFTSKLNEMAKKTVTDFDSIQNDILYAVGKDSSVEDKMGSEFKFVPDSLKLTVGGAELASKTEGNVTYFGDDATALDAANYRFKVKYDDAEDKFLWTINENVSNFAPVQLSYKVQLDKPSTKPGDHKVHTNEYAKLTPKDSSGVMGTEQEFPKPEVTYTVDEQGNVVPGVEIFLPAFALTRDDHYSYLIGYSDGTVRPNGKITRAEVATIFFRLLDDDTRAKYWSSENNFSDVSADKWYNNAVSTLSHMGVIGGYADGTFRPDAPISRAEFAKIAVSFTQNNGSAVYNYFTDVKTTDWFAPYVTAAKDAGLIEGYSDGSFKPESKITRAEACAIVNRTLGRKPSKAHMKISGRIDWPDVQTTDWFYEAIMEATNSHTCTMGDRVETWTGKLPQRDWATLETGWANAYTGR